MPKGMAVTRMMPMNSKPLKTCPIAGIGTEKPIFDSPPIRRSRLRPPVVSPIAAAPQAISTPKAIATSPAGMPRG